MTERGPKVLLVTAPPTIFGGVAIQGRGLAEFLRDRGYRVTIAHYATLGSEPNLTVPAQRLLVGQRPGVRRYQVWDGFDCIAIGCRLPELEANYYGNSPLWSDLLAEHDRYLTVSGNVLVAAPLLATGRRHLIWCASTVRGDRADRQLAMSPPRGAYDRLIVSPLLHRLERRVLAGSGTLATISTASADALRKAGMTAGKKIDVLPIPVDSTRFSPPIATPRPGVVGIAGRHTDPRKNAGLALEAVARARNLGVDITLRVAGEVTLELREMAARADIAGAVDFLGKLDDAEMPAFYRSIDILLIPSRQEGLNIAGLEAGACGVPIVTTRCGGPEDYVTDGETGFVTGFEPTEIAARLSELYEDRGLRYKLSRNIRAWVISEYGMERFSNHLDRLWRMTWNEPLLAFPQNE
jgi:glycosyltransferase involved in cell wall biosynthesis